MLFGDTDNWLPIRYCDEILLAARISSPEAQSLVSLRKGEYVKPSRDRAARRIKHASRGLIEVTADGKVQFIHETVREFFLTGPGLGILDPKLADNPIALSYEVLVRGSLNVANGNFGPALFHRFNGHVLTYAYSVEKHGGSNATLLESICAGRYRREGQSVLQTVCNLNLTSCVHALLEQGVHPDDSGGKSEFATPLLAALLRGVPPGRALIKALIKAGANLEACTFNGMTPLLVALENGWAGVAKYLATHGANIHARHSNRGAIHYLLEGQSRCHRFYERSSTSLAPNLLVDLLRRGVDPTGGSPVGFPTPLHLAAKYGNVHAAAALLAHHVPLHTSDDKGHTPLMCAAGSRSPQAAEICALLLKHGADIDFNADGGVTPLMCAAGCSNPEVCALLLKQGADPNFINEKGWAALPWALDVGHNIDVFKMLLGAGTDVNKVGPRGQNALHILVTRMVRWEDRENWADWRHWKDEERIVAVVRLVVEAGCDREAKDEDGLRPLDVALVKGLKLGAVLRGLLDPAGSGPGKGEEDSRG